MLPGTPRTFLDTIHEFASRKDAPKSTEFKKQRKAMAHDQAMKIAEKWAIETEMWDREWSSLSGGEAQRMSLAIALGLEGTEILLLDGK